MCSRVLVMAVLVSAVLAACDRTASVEATPGTRAPESATVMSTPVSAPEPEGWNVQNPSVPEALDVAVLDGGLTLNSYVGSDRVVVTMVYPAGDLKRIVDAYDEWIAEADGSRSGRSLDVGVRVVWSQTWIAGRSEARMTECLNQQTGDFDDLCVALTTWVGSEP